MPEVPSPSAAKPPRRVPALVPVLAAVLLAGCGADRQAERMLEQVRAGQWSEAQSTAADLREDDGDALLRAMELGMIAHLAGDYDTSLRQLEAAVPMVQEVRGGSLLGRVGSWVVNDTVAPYAGRDYEHLQVEVWRTVGHLLASETADGDWRPPLTPHPTALAGSDHRQRAVTAARHMALSGLKTVSDDPLGGRYDDDPFARLLAAITVLGLPADERAASDEQFATVMLGTALRAYEAQYARLGTGQPFRYEVAERPRLASGLWLRHLRGYDPVRYRDEAARLGQEAMPLPPGCGSLLILDHVGFIVRPEPLQIGIGAAGHGDGTSFSLGGIGFFAKGPGHEIANSWVAVPVPGELVQHLLAPGGAAVIGCEVPVHRADRPLGSPAALRVGAQAPIALEVVCDIDAYARAALKDDQPALIVRTLTRLLVKQGLVAGAAYGVRRRGSSEAQLLAFLVNLIGSALMTATESADLRAWLTLPNHIDAAIIDLPVGIHHLVLEGRSGTIDLGQVVIAAGRIAVVAARTFTSETELQKDPP